MTGLLTTNLLATAGSGDSTDLFLLTMIPLLPLIGFLINGYGAFGKGPDARGGGSLASVMVFGSFAFAVCLFAQLVRNPDQSAIAGSLFTWIAAEGFSVDFGFHVDHLASVMLLVVTGVGFLIHLYSISYMRGDRGEKRFFAYLNLFMFAMLLLVMGDNLLVMFIGWEGVGLASYLLIGFWYKKPSANAAAIKACIVNRVGDFGFALGIMGVYLIFDTVKFDEVFALAPTVVGQTFTFLSWEVPVLTTLCLLLFVGAMGKSAQFLLHTWLPDAMEGPTPVSALIHAATMVTAGVFLV